jgi:hypothetical protein
MPETEPAANALFEQLYTDFNARRADLVLAAGETPSRIRPSTTSTNWSRA